MIPVLGMLAEALLSRPSARGIDVMAAIWRGPGLHRIGGLVYDGLVVPGMAAWNRRHGR